MNATCAPSPVRVAHVNAAFITKFSKTDSPETRKIASLNPPSSDDLIRDPQFSGGRFRITMVHAVKIGAKIAASLPQFRADFHDGITLFIFIGCSKAI